VEVIAYEVAIASVFAPARHPEIANVTVITHSAPLWCRSRATVADRDAMGLSGIVNGISAARERFLDAGGLGILVGDGRLPHPGAEQILETYYRLPVVGWAQLTLDYQYVVNPVYNTDRGPVSIFSVCIHAQL
jgi:hypothetical protein